MVHPSDVAGHPLTVSWRVRRQTLFMYEADLDALAPLVPARLPLREVRPNIGLAVVECLDYLPGHFGDATSSFEIVFSAMVEPNLGVAMPVPQLSLFIVDVLSSSAAFVANETVLLRMPMTHHPHLHMAFSDSATSVEVTDRGEPLASLRNTVEPPAYVHKVNWGLTYTQLNGKIHQGAFRWEGEVFEHQRGGAHGGLAPHPFFHGVAPRSCYRQMASNPKVTAEIAYYHLGEVDAR